MRCSNGPHAGGGPGQEISGRHMAPLFFIIKSLVCNLKYYIRGMQTDKPTPTPEQMLEALTNAIKAYERKTGAKPEAIIMHPYSCGKLITYVAERYLRGFTKDDKYEFCGIKVYRSLDIDESKFKIL